MEEKKVTQEEIMNKINDIHPAIPQELVNYYLESAGFKSSDPKITKLISLSAQKFISEICTDSMNYCKQRQTNPIYRDKVSSSKEKRYVLSVDDLVPSLKEYGINVKKPEYYSDTTSSTKNPLE